MGRVAGCLKALPGEDRARPSGQFAEAERAEAGMDALSYLDECGFAPSLQTGYN
ncbi:hypothetical protein [Singulisphaera sp. PoT]|uniref:hypothetical protein n=1 Tax=Singulisphaera sp. PoT TaxID=3411797 RepID=UPI003BF58384